MTHFIPSHLMNGPNRPNTMRAYLIQHLPDPHGPEAIPSGPYPQPDLQVTQQQQQSSWDLNRQLREK